MVSLENFDCLYIAIIMLFIDCYKTEMTDYAIHTKIFWRIEPIVIKTWCYVLIELKTVLKICDPEKSSFTCNLMFSVCIWHCTFGLYLHCLVVKNITNHIAVKLSRYPIYMNTKIHNSVWNIVIMVFTKS